MQANGLNLNDLRDSSVPLKKVGMYWTLKVRGLAVHEAPLLNKMHTKDKDNEQDEGINTKADIDFRRTVSAIVHERYASNA